MVTNLKILVKQIQLKVFNKYILILPLLLNVFVNPNLLNKIPCIKEHAHMRIIQKVQK